MLKAQCHLCQVIELGKIFIPIALGALGGFSAVAMSIEKYKEKVDSLDECKADNKVSAACERIAKIEAMADLFKSFQMLTQRQIKNDAISYLTLKLWDFPLNN